ncbi:MAG: hypothetical protein LLG08_00370 [Actinomycetia bacterium]|nr:hypothetical protein [Actinomycetes bacterium]
MGPAFRIGTAIVLALCFFALVAFNLYSIRVYAKSGVKGAPAARAIRIINVVLLVGAFALVVWAVTR